MKILFTLLILLFFQCDNFSYNNSFKKFFDKEKPVKILLISSEATLIKKKEKDIPYAYQDFIGNVYTDSLINFLNENKSLLRIDFLDKKKSPIKDKKIIYAHSISLIDNKSKNEITEILQNEKYSLYAKINISYSLWQQKVIGKVRIFDDKNQIFEYRINQQSKEIILDKESPYAIEDKNFFHLPTDKNKTHAGELIQIFKKMARQCSNDIIKILERKNKK